MKTNILGVNFDSLTPRQALGRALGFLTSEGAKTIFTPNPEMVMLAQKDAEFLRVLNSGDLVVPDGIGVVYASRLTEDRIAERVPGIELLLGLLESGSKTGAGFYFLGGREGRAEAAKRLMKRRFQGIKIVGARHGFFEDSEDEGIVREINEREADVVLVGLGFGRQEKWIDRHKHALNAKILMGVGGSLDVLGGSVKRAPELFRKAGLEWFYRLMRQPSRVVRQRDLIKFAFAVLHKKIVGKL